MQLLLILTLTLVLASCTREPAPLATGPHATVMLRDGTRLEGSVVASSPRQIVVSDNAGTQRSLDMKLVKSVEYADPAPAPVPDPQTPAIAPAQPQTAASAPPPRVVELDPVHEKHYHPEESAVTTTTHLLQPGTEIAIRTEETIDSGKAVEGQTFAAELTRSVSDANGAVVIPRGANAQVIIRSASKGGRFKGAADLVLDLQSIAIGGRQYRVSTTDMLQKGREGVGTNKRTAEFGGAGAAIGAVIGAIAGGGKGAAIGAGAGAGAGVLGQVITKGGAIRVPAESVLIFRLDQPLRVVAAQ